MSEIISPCYLSQVKPHDLDRELNNNPELVGAVWNYFKAKFVDKGIGYNDAMDAMSQELGVPRSLVSKILSKPKVLRPFLNDVYLKNRARQQALAQARLEAKHVNAPGLPKGVKFVADSYRGLKTLLHGPVFLFTHAMDVLKQPTKIGKFLSAYKRSWEFMSVENHREAMETLRDDVAYPWAVRSGLVVDPERGPIGILAKKSGTWSSRAWDALKILRLNLFKQELFTDEGEWKPKFASLSDQEKLEVGKAVAERWNHLTGALSPGDKNLNAFSEVMFAPELTAAKWHSFLGDNKKAAAIVTRRAAGNELSAAERKFLGTVMRTNGEIVAGRAISLAINAGLLQAGIGQSPNGKKQELNFTHPERADWLRPKAFGQVFNMRGQDEIIQLLGKMYAISRQTPQQTARKRSTRMEQRATTAGRYAFSKLAPAPEKITEFSTGEDFRGNPLPFSKEHGNKYHHKVSTGEFVAGTFTPIFMEGAVHEFYQGMRDAGLDAHSANAIMRGLTNPKIVGRALLVGAEEFTGLGVYDENH